MFSVIIPTLNEERYIGALLDNLAGQTRQDFEVIIVDSDSSDRTWEVVESFQGKVPALRLVEEPRRGLARARNTGAAFARGGTLIFMEADCLIENDFLETCIREAEERGLGCANVLSRPLSRRWFDRLYYKIFLDWALRVFQYFFPVITGYFIYVTREVFDRIDGFNNEITFEDTDFAQRARKVTRFRMLRKRRLYTSVRRLDSDGRIRCLLRSILVTFYQITLGNIRINSRIYAFGHHRQDDFHKKVIRHFPLDISPDAFPEPDGLAEKKKDPASPGER